jgi:hypothetical protein
MRGSGHQCSMEISHPAGRNIQFPDMGWSFSVDSNRNTQEGANDLE